MDFYVRISELCKEKGVSMAAVARKIGLSNSATTYWKRGSIPKGDTLQKLADYFGVSIDSLLGNADDDAEFLMRMKEGEFHTQMNTAFFELNFTGKKEAARRVEELTEIPRYRLQKSLEPPAEGSGGKDTQAGEEPPEGTQGPGGGE